MSELRLKGTTRDDPRLFPLEAESHQEIDLIELLGMLSAAKKTIMSITLSAVLAGLCGSFLMPQKWSSQAVITPPEASQLIELQRATVQLTVLDVAVNNGAEHIYQNFLKDFDSLALREEYLANSNYVKQLVDTQNANDKAKLHRLIQGAAVKFKAVNNADPKLANATSYSSWTLSFTGPNAEESRNVLSGYIDFITRRVNQDTVQNLRYAVELKNAVEKDRLQLDKINLANQHKVNIQRLGYSLEVANAAGIKKPVYSHGQAVKDDPDYSVALGADGLAEKLKIESSLKDAAELNASVQNREHYLTKLAKVEFSDVHFQPFRYQMAPSLPLRKEGPGKTLIVVLATLVGFIGGSGFVLLRNIVSDHKKNSGVV